MLKLVLLPNIHNSTKNKLPNCRLSQPSAKNLAFPIYFSVISKQLTLPDR